MKFASLILLEYDTTFVDLLNLFSCSIYYFYSYVINREIVYNKNEGRIIVRVCQYIYVYTNQMILTPYTFSTESLGTESIYVQS